MRPSLFNLIIYAEDKKRFDFFQEIISTVTQKFPCHIIYIKGNPNTDQNRIEVIEKSELGYDQVTISVEGSSMKQVPFLVLTHIASDLPVYLLWGQDPTAESEILPHLAHFSTHLIFDSEYTDNLQAFSEKMLKRKDRWGCRIVDMNWARFSGWRHVLLQAYDTPERVEELRTSEKITIKYNSTLCESYHHCEVQAVYMQAWLAAQLEWSFQKQETQKSTKLFYYTCNQHNIVVQLTPQELDVFASGALVSFESSSAGNTTQLFRQQDNPTVVCAKIASENSCQVPFTIPLSTMTRGLTFIKQLLYTPTSPHYYHMLKILSRSQC